MGLGLVTDDRSREEGRHYTDDSAVRLHDCGAFGEAKPLKHPTLPAPGSCRSKLARDADAAVFQVNRVVVHREQARSHRFWVVAKELKKRAWGVNPQALKR